MLPAAANPRVSVLLPVRNGAHTVAAAVASIQAQTFPHWELVAIDDGSSDASAEVLSRLARAEPRVRLFRRPAEGLVAALQTGLGAARGELIARMDADDVAHPERLAAQVEFLDQPGRGAIGVVGCRVEFGGDRAARRGYALHVEWLNGITTPEAIARNRFVESPHAHPSVMFRRELVARHGGYRAGDFPEDYELWLRWLEAGVQMAKVPRVLLRWNDPPERLSRTDVRYSPEAFFRLKAEWLARWLHRECPLPAPDQTVWRRAAVHGAAGREILVWGAGRPTRQRARWLERHGVRIAGYIDVDARKIAPALGGTGVPVLSPAQLPAPGRVFVLGYVATRGARELIRAELERRRYVEGRDFLMCA
ncbi:MAG: glycosyltransferase family 2 protein [Verrucomicrobia bacterium]|nr:glycosyltransferase family 2 protein [Verrucomicrobiota bacterium]